MYYVILIDKSCDKHVTTYRQSTAKNPAKCSDVLEVILVFVKLSKADILAL